MQKKMQERRDIGSSIMKRILRIIKFEKNILLSRLKIQVIFRFDRTSPYYPFILLYNFSTFYYRANLPDRSKVIFQFVAVFKYEHQILLSNRTYNFLYLSNLKKKNNKEKKREKRKNKTSKNYTSRIYRNENTE